MSGSKETSEKQSCLISVKRGYKAISKVWDSCHHGDSHGWNCGEPSQEVASLTKLLQERINNSSRSQKNPEQQKWKNEKKEPRNILHILKLNLPLKTSLTLIMWVKQFIKAKCVLLHSHHSGRVQAWSCGKWKKCVCPSCSESDCYVFQVQASHDRGIAAHRPAPCQTYEEWS